MRDSDIRWIELDFTPLRRLRQRLHIGQSRLGEAVGCTQSAIARYEGNTRTPSARRLVQLAVACGTPMHELFTTEHGQAPSRTPVRALGATRTPEQRPSGSKWHPASPPAAPLTAVDPSTA